MSDRFKDLILLHSNDLHGDFLAENIDEKLVGGVSMLSGYVSKIRAENPHALYCISGDMLQGSLIDSEFKGLSTIEIMNILDPDIVSLGNHEIDYGLAHLLFLERCANFPIVNANLFIKNPYTRLFDPYKFIKINGMNILFIGIITMETMRNIKTDALLGSLINVEDAAREVGHICNAYRTIDVDFTVLLTHVGFEEDKRLASMLDPEWGVDVIIGGHSHTVLEKPEEVNGILIVQAGAGTDHIGRFDIVVDTDNNSIHSWKWQLVPIDSEHCERDPFIEKTIQNFKQQTDDKFERVLCRFRRTLTHPKRGQETELGNLFADGLRDRLGVDLMLLGSGSFRRNEAGPVLTLRDLREVFPYDDKVVMIKASGAQLKRMLAHVLREEVLKGEVRNTFYQLSSGIRAVYNRKARSFDVFEFEGEPLADDNVLKIGLQNYHYINIESALGIPAKELVDGKAKVLTNSTLDILEEYFINSHEISAQVEGRLEIIHGEDCPVA